MWQWLKEEWHLAGDFKRILAVFGLLIILGLLGAIIWSVLNPRILPEVGEEPGRPVEEAPYLTLEEVLEASKIPATLKPSERIILERHFQAIGGLKRVSTVNSVLVFGEILFENGARQPVVVAKKSGRKMRISVKAENGIFVMGVTPETSWRAFYEGGHLSVVTEMDPEEVEKMRRSSYVVSELYMALENEWTIRYVGEVAFNGSAAHCFEVQLDAANIVRFFLDPETFLDLGRENWHFGPDGQPEIARIIGSEHVDFSRLKVPARLETYQDGVLKQTFMAHEVEVNPGILDSSFERPESLIPENAKP